MAGQASYQRVRLLVKDSNGDYHDVVGGTDGKLLIGPIDLTGSAISIQDGDDEAQGATDDAAWDGVAGVATGISIQKYIGAKIEALRALLALGVVNTELPVAAALADAASSTPTTPTLGAILEAVQAGDLTKVDRLLQDAKALRVSLVVKKTSAGDTVLALGQGTGANSLPVVIASDQGAVAVGGGIASAAADSGNPVKTGAKVNSSAPTFTNGQRADAQADANGNLLVSLATLVAGEDLTLNRLATMAKWLVGRVTADGQIKASAGYVHTVTIAPTTAIPTAGLLTVYDNTAESGTVIYSEWVFATTPGHTVTLDVVCGTGIYVGYDAALTNVSVTVSYL